MYEYENINKRVEEISEITVQDIALLGAKDAIQNALFGRKVDLESKFNQMEISGKTLSEKEAKKLNDDYFNLVLELENYHNFDNYGLEMEYDFLKLVKEMNKMLKLRLEVSNNVVDKELSNYSKINDLYGMLLDYSFEEDESMELLNEKLNAFVDLKGIINLIKKLSGRFHPKLLINLLEIIGYENWGKVPEIVNNSTFEYFSIDEDYSEDRNTRIVGTYLEDYEFVTDIPTFMMEFIDYDKAVEKLEKLGWKFSSSYGFKLV